MLDNIKEIFITVLLVFLGICGIAMVDVAFEQDLVFLRFVGGFLNFGALIYLGMRIQRSENEDS